MSSMVANSLAKQSPQMQPHSSDKDEAPHSPSRVRLPTALVTPAGAHSSPPFHHSSAHFSDGDIYGTQSQSGPAAVAALAAASGRGQQGGLTSSSAFSKTVSLKLVLVVALCLFTIGPAVTMWLLSWDAGNKGLNTVLNLSEYLLEDVSLQLRITLIHRAADAVMHLLDQTETLMSGMLMRLQGDRVFERSSGTDPPISIFDGQLKELGYMFMQYDWMRLVSFDLLSRLAPWDPPPDPVNNPFPAQAYTYQRMGFSFKTMTPMDTVYFLRLNQTGFKNETSVEYWWVDDITGAPVYNAWNYQGNFVVPKSPGDSFPYPEGCVWLDLFKFDFVGVPVLMHLCQIAFANQESVLSTYIMTDVYVISDYLKTLVKGDKDRLYLTYRTDTGFLLGASHGKFYSHSDQDYYHRNPFLEELPVNEFQQYTSLNSTDLAIRQSGELLFAKYGAWDAIPEVNIECTLADWPYWIASDHVTSKAGLKLQLFLLADREVRMGLVERTKTNTLADISRSNRRLIIILSVVVAVAFLIALVISLLLTRALDRLASGMDALSMLDFHRCTFCAITSRYSEVAKCESSFLALGRGLKAFVKYVPRDVVKMMLTGEMASENIMTHRTITVLFMDIVNFTEICEKVSPEVLMKISTEYLQSMCEAIVDTGGVLDKFIGDCIMAIWNAPAPLTRHECAACQASLEAQTRCHNLCLTWAAESLPQLRFRVGINTDRVWVGNYGCDYRINFTCLGDGVNLASRLETVNRHFGTVVLASTATKSAADPYFAFRRIGKITVPGKQEVVDVFELLFKRTNDSPTAGQYGSDGQLLSPSSAAPSACQSLNLSMQFSLPRIGLLDRPPSATTNPLVAASGIPGRLSCSPDRQRLNLEVEAPILFHWELIAKNTVESLSIFYEKGIEYFIAGGVDAAIAQFQSALQLCPTDGAATLLLELCQQQQQSSGGGGRYSPRLHRNVWDGVIRIDKKGVSA